MHILPNDNSLRLARTAASRQPLGSESNLRCGIKQIYKYIDQKLDFLETIKMRYKYTRQERTNTPFGIPPLPIDIASVLRK